VTKEQIDNKENVNPPLEVQDTPWKSDEVSKMRSQMESLSRRFKSFEQSADTRENVSGGGIGLEGDPPEGVKSRRNHLVSRSVDVNRIDNEFKFKERNNNSMDLENIISK